MSTTRRVAAAVGLAALIVVVTTTPAAAHTLSGAPPTNYRSEIQSVSQGGDGIRVRLRNLGRQVELRNASATDVVVLGYDGEPYLRIGPEGAFENRRSPTTYLNRTGSPAPPAGTDSSAAPDWHRMSTSHTVSWRDRRTRWEGADPPQVTARPDEVHVVVPSWKIELRQGDQAITVTGRILYVPPAGAAPWVAVAVVLGLAAAAAGWPRSWPALLSGMVAILIAVDLVHSTGLAAFDASGTGEVLLRLLGRNTVAPVVWALGIWSIAGLQRGEDRAVLVAIGVAIVIALVGGLSDVAALTRSQLPFAYAPVTARAAVAASMGLGVGIAAGGVVALRRHLPVSARPAPARSSPPPALSRARPARGRPSTRRPAARPRR